MKPILVVVAATLVALPAFVVAQVTPQQLPCAQGPHLLNCTNPIEVHETHSEYDFPSYQAAADWASNPANIDAARDEALGPVYGPWECLCVPNPSKDCSKTWEFFGETTVEICGCGGSWQVDVTFDGYVIVCCGPCFGGSQF